MKFYLGLVHGPVKNKIGEQVTTSVTNLDIHDIARSARTFGFLKYFIITPIVEQKKLVGRILGHWESDKGSVYNPDRSDALKDAQVIDSIEMACDAIFQQTQKKPLVVVTGANFKSYDGDEKKLLTKIRLDDRPMLLLFGTGWGLTASVVESADFRLTPIFGNASDGYNHLSVRSAVAIYTDRLARSLLDL
jgi:hypothetical protein